MELIDRENAALSQIPQDLRSVPYSTPMHNFQSAITTLTSPEDELYMLELELRSMTLDKDGNPKQIGEPLLNEEGIRSILFQIRAAMSRVVIMSNLTEKFVADGTIYLAESLAKDLMMNRDKYEITNTMTRTKIYRLCNMTINTVLKRSQDEGERRFWKGSQQEITTRIDGGQNKSGGMWGAVKNMFK